MIYILSSSATKVLNQCWAPVSLDQVMTRRGFTIRPKRLKPRDPDFGDPKILEL